MPLNIPYTDDKAKDAAGLVLENSTGNINFQYDENTDTLTANAPTSGGNGGGTLPVVFNGVLDANLSIPLPEGTQLVAAVGVDNDAYVAPEYYTVDYVSATLTFLPSYTGITVGDKVWAVAFLTGTGTGGGNTVDFIEEDINSVRTKFQNNELQVLKWYKLTGRGSVNFVYNPEINDYEFLFIPQPDAFATFFYQDNANGLGFLIDNSNKFGLYNLFNDTIADTIIEYNDLDYELQQRLSLLTTSFSGGISVGLNNDIVNGANPYQAIAIGLGNVVNQYAGMALGTDCKSLNVVDYAMGIRAIAQGGRSIAIGIDVKSIGGRSIVIGGGSESNGAYSVVIGEGSKTTANNQVIIGAFYTAPSNYPNTCFTENIRIRTNGGTLTFTAPDGSLNTISFNNSGRMVINNIEYAPFTPVSENQFGIHPAFTNQHDLNAYLLSK